MIALHWRLSAASIIIAQIFRESMNNFREIAIWATKIQAAICAQCIKTGRRIEFSSQESAVLPLVEMILKRWGDRKKRERYTAHNEGGA